MRMSGNTRGASSGTTARDGEFRPIPYRNLLEESEVVGSGLP